MKTKRITMATMFVSLLVLMSAVVMIERFGILAGDHTASMDDLPQTYIDKASSEENHQLDSLIIMDDSEVSQRHTEQMAFILKSMDVGFDQYMVTAENSDPLPDLRTYKTVVLSTSQLDILMGHGYLDILFEWVKGGGGLLNLIPNAHSEAIEVYKEQLGINSVKSGGIEVDKIKIVSDFMIGAQDFEYDLEGFSTYAMNVGMDVAIAEGPTIHVIQQETNTPIVWETEYGDGRIVVNNIDMSEKTTRGMLVAEYSLLQDTFAYPVINSSIFFIDDFPAPIPEGQNEYITKYYNMDMRSFFSNVWLPDIMKMSRDYNIPFTSVLINTYKNSTAPPYNESVDKEFFTFYGNLILSVGGEIGYHGYNHQPLTLEGFDFTHNLGYKSWASTEDMMAAMNVMVENTKWLFPSETVSVYVPPSNILSQEARQAFSTQVEEIKSIASLYVVTGSEYEQEFTVAEDGIVELPRTVSGLELSMYDRWLAMNELNFHFVNSHFFHPDDLMDAARGGDKGWEYLKTTFEDYLKWLETSAPGLRNQKASDGAKAVKRYYSAEITQEASDADLKIEIDNFYDSIFCIVRIRENTISSVEGGKVTQLTSELYLLEATQPTVTMQFQD